MLILLLFACIYITVACFVRLVYMDACYRYRQQLHRGGE